MEEILAVALKLIVLLCKLRNQYLVELASELLLTSFDSTFHDCFELQRVYEYQSAWLTSVSFGRGVAPVRW